MRKLEIIQSKTEPSKHNLWLTKDESGQPVIKKFGSNGWEPMGANSKDLDQLKEAIKNITDMAPEDLDTLKEVADKIQQIQNEILNIDIDSIVQEFSTKEELQELSNQLDLQEPRDLDIPRVFITWTKSYSDWAKECYTTPEKTYTVKGKTYKYKEPEKVTYENEMTLEYISKTSHFKETLPKFKVQGDASITSAKKNFAITFDKKKIFKDWDASKKFVLKGNYQDGTHLRNIVLSDIWRQIEESREDWETAVPEDFRNTSAKGAIDGFPVKVYWNGEYRGIYTWNYPKSKAMCGINPSKKNPDHCMITTNHMWNIVQLETYMLPKTDPLYGLTSKYYRSNWDGSGEQISGWELEEGGKFVDGVYVEDIIPDKIITTLNAIIDVANDYSLHGESFTDSLEEAGLDVQSAIDCFILDNVFYITDSMGKNQLLYTFDCEKLYYAAYDLESGMMAGKGTAYNTPFIQKCNAPENLLYQRLWNEVPNRWKERYFTLRESVFTPQNIIPMIENSFYRIGTELWNEDNTIVSVQNRTSLKDLRNYIRQRLVFCDGIFNAMEKQILCEQIAPITQNLIIDTPSYDIKNNLTLIPSDQTEGITYSILTADQTIATLNSSTITFTEEGTVQVQAKPNFIPEQNTVKAVFNITYTVQVEPEEPDEPVVDQPVYIPEHAELAYIGTKGGNYLDTLYVPNDNTTIDVTFAFPEISQTSASVRQSIYNSCVANELDMSNNYGSQTFCGTFLKTTQFNYKKLLYGKHNVITSVGVVYIDGVDVSNYVKDISRNVTKSLKLYTTSTTSHIKETVLIYSLDFSENGELVKSFRPTVINRKPCFYESVEGKVYEIVGDDVIYYATAENPDVQLEYHNGELLPETPSEEVLYIGTCAGELYCN